MNLYETEAGKCYIQKQQIKTVALTPSSSDTYNYGNGYYCIYGRSPQDLSYDSTYAYYVIYTTNGYKPEVEDVRAPDGRVVGIKPKNSNTKIYELNENNYFIFTEPYIENCFYCNLSINDSTPKASIVAKFIIFQSPWGVINYTSNSTATKIPYYEPISVNCLLASLPTITSNIGNKLVSGETHIANYNSSYAWEEVVKDKSYYMTDVSLTQNHTTVPLSKTTTDEGDLTFTTSGKDISSFKAGQMTLSWKVAYKKQIGNVMYVFTSAFVSYTFNVIHEPAVLYVKDGSTWKKGMVYVKVPFQGQDIWFESDKLYVKVNGVWKESIS